nr:acyl-CoA dehydratase activase [uncultured Lachnoclostridium sp.]
MYFAGIDIGSMTAETVIINDKKEICASFIVKSGASHKEALEKSFEQALNMAQITREDIKYIVSTGYGRINVDFADKQVTEIACHGKGSHFLFPNTRTVIDIGGQDSKIIKLNKKGKVIDFLMNDKCAAGTGRFLEVMANALEINVEELGEYSMKSQKPAKISCMCGIFAESEVVSKIASGETKEDIVRGLHNSIASRILGMVNRVKKEEEVTMTGGGAKNIGVVHAMQEQLKCQINVPEDPQIVGALGAALFSLEEYYANNE